MKKLNTSPISGMQELLPKTQAVFNAHKAEIAEVFMHHGFQAIETPTIDRTEILLAKAGGDTEKQIYKVVKTAETADDADQALRFDHTVPLSRYVVEHQNDITFPFRVTQIGRNFRGERAQKGRFRELYQCDVDVIGRGKLPVAYDAEVILTLMNALDTFKLPNVTARVSNRKLLTGLLDELVGEGNEAVRAEVFSIIDHAEKVPAEKTKEALDSLGLTEENVVKITTFMNINGPLTEIEPKLRSLNIMNEKFNEGLDELIKVLSMLNQAPGVVIADMMIVRGLDYYTGTVFEFILPDYRHIGSICGGGRYDNLASNYTDESFPGVGGSIGLTRLFYVLNENNLLGDEITQPIDIAIIPISENEFGAAIELASKIRATKRSVDVVFTDKRLGDKMTYASKVAKSGIVIGETEAASGTFQIKDFTTGETTPFNI